LSGERRTWEPQFSNSREEAEALRDRWMQTLAPQFPGLVVEITAVASRVADAEIEARRARRNKALLTELCRPLFLGARPRSAQQLGDHFGVATPRISQLLNELADEYGMPEGDRGTRWALLARYAVDHEIVTRDPSWDSPTDDQSATQ
jgi:hypothetical protein